MRSVRYLLAAALVSGVPGAAMAQTSPSSNPVPVLAPANDAGSARSHWTASGFVGSNFGASSDVPLIDNHSSFDVGGAVAYLWKGIVGAEFLTDFAPSFNIGNVSIPNGPHLSTYMANAIGVIPLGPNGQFQPFVSGGWGGINMRTNIETGIGTPADPTVTNSDSQLTWGGNIGFGAMAFVNKMIGLRADIRYYRAGTNNNLTGSLDDQLTQHLVSGLSFWRSGVGVAFQW